MNKLLLKRTGFWLAVLLSLSACGFHLRGAYQLPAELSSVYLSGKNQHSELLQDMQRILQSNGSQVVSDATKAQATINIEKENSAERVISVDSLGRAREYELKLEIVFSLSVQVENEIARFRIKSRKLELIRDYVYDNEAVLGKTREKAILIRDMQRDASRLIMLQIQAAYREMAISDSKPDAATNNDATDITKPQNQTD